MPFSIVHVEIWTKLKNYLPKEDNFLEFLAWNIFVDSSYNLMELWILIDRDITHFYSLEWYFKSDFPYNFKIIELDNNFSYFNLWYYFHLILDKLWRDSNFVWDCYKDVDKENLYQLSRIVYSKYDLNSYIKAYWADIIDKLYNYKLDKNKLPKIYYDINVELLQSTYISILDYMTWKNHFIKVESKYDLYKIVNNKIVILDKKVEQQMNKYFPYEKYLELKNRWLEILNDELLIYFKDIK